MDIVTTAISDSIVSEIDRNARAYGWEIAKHNLQITEVVLMSEDNPFVDPLWRTQIQKDT